MRLFVTVHGKPAIIVGYGPGKTAPKAIVIGLSSTPEAVDLSDCELPKLPKRLRRKMMSVARAETVDARKELLT